MFVLFPGFSGGSCWLLVIVNLSLFIYLLLFAFVIHYAVVFGCVVSCCFLFGLNRVLALNIS